MATRYYAIRTFGGFTAGQEVTGLTDNQYARLLRQGVVQSDSDTWVRRRQRVYAHVGADVAWVNPAALTELSGATNRRNRIDLSDADQVRLHVQVAVAFLAGATFLAQYSADGGTTWATLSPTIAVDVVGLRSTAWVDIPVAAKADVLVRIAGQGGNGTASGSYGGIAVEAK